LDFNKIIRDLKNKVYQPIYLLYGEEEFFIDQISDYIEDHVLEESEKEFNQSVLYGLDTEVRSLIAEAKRYPMMASYNVVIVKEAQKLRGIYELESYLKQHSPTTILVLCYKHGKVDGRKNFVKLAKKLGVVFESKRLYDNQIPAWIEEYLKGQGAAIEPKAMNLMVEFLGNDLSKISNELDKLLINLKEGERINDQLIEQNIGISKDYNVFELNNALGSKDVMKANRIINYFGQNEKDHAVPATLPMMYRFFSQILLFHHFSPADDRTLASKMGTNPFFLKDYKVAAKHYTVKKVAKIIEYMREADLQSKGVKGGGVNTHDIYKELIFKILH
jgi:DNA polymerase-3 subunit delta